jgi:DNA-directed RNA polymerase specialized sigma24 family protein
MSAADVKSDPAPFQGVLEALRHDDDAAWREVLARYSKRLILLARSRMFKDALRQKLDPEDVVQSVLRTFVRRNRDEKFQWVESWDGLWGLLMGLTVYRAARWFRHYNTQSRDLDKESPLPATEPGGESDQQSAIAMLESSDPRPDEVAEMLETVREILQRMPESQRRVIELGLLGYDDDAIGEEAGRTRARVGQIRADLAGELEKALDDLRNSGSAT